MNRNRNRIVTVVVSLALAAVILLLSRIGISPGGERLEVLKTTILEECKPTPLWCGLGTKRWSSTPEKRRMVRKWASFWPIRVSTRSRPRMAASPFSATV